MFAALLVVIDDERIGSLYKIEDQLELFQMSIKTLPDVGLRSHCSEIVEFEAETDGSGGGVRVETTLDNWDGRDGPRSLRRTTLTANVALGTRATAWVAQDGGTEYTTVELGSGEAHEELKATEQLRRINCSCTLKTDA